MRGRVIPMDQEQKEEIYREYSADNMKKLRKLIGYQTTRFGKGCGYKWVDKDYVNGIGNVLK